MLKTFTDLYSKITALVGDVYGAITENIRSGKGFREYLVHLLKGEAKKQFTDPAISTYISYLIFMSNMNLRCC